MINLEILPENLRPFYVRQVNGTIELNINGTEIWVSQLHWESDLLRFSNEFDSLNFILKVKDSQLALGIINNYQAGKTWLLPKGHVRINKQRLQMIRDLVVAEKEFFQSVNFDLDSWVARLYNDEGYRCGTTHCIMGLAATLPEFQKLGLRLDEGGDLFYQGKALGSNAVGGFLQLENHEISNYIYNLKSSYINKMQDIFEYLFTSDGYGVSHPSFDTILEHIDLVMENCDDLN